ncbi:hypothetical protein CYLTODRAFT_457306 [Cylindrobasidium torrendii FP15055 ss-10]|uniref:Uncharacterized protein n=1 Tax=Cylindrobasidium torrendii FP15055 ss-10 TaxID=1314674 RepID=A0A0D7B2D1_9AGAR|nr:hypothetical protein CYLTODRAFT_457306 [Cylindrobasidium torrendii FP15055 ss-10]
MFTTALLSAALLTVPATARWAEYTIGAVNVPDGKSFEFRRTDGDWKVTSPNHANTDLSSIGNGGEKPEKYGWRFQDEVESTGVLAYDNTIDPLREIELYEGDHEISPFWTNTINANFANTKSSRVRRIASKRDDPWESGDFQPLVFTGRTLRASNSACDYGMGLKIEYADEKGNTKELEGDDDIKFSIPDDSGKFNATVSAPEFNTSAVLNMSGEGPFSFAVGTAGPTFEAGYTLDIQFCPD